jgi:hypothetical protein
LTGSYLTGVSEGRRRRRRRRRRVAVFDVRAFSNIWLELAKANIERNQPFTRT